MNRRLWVWSDLMGLGYLHGRSHVSDPGWFLVWWEREQDAYGCSLYELESCSADAAAWLDGFFSGAEPKAWFDDPEFDYLDDDPRTTFWRESVRLFHQTGVWAVGQTCEICGVEMLPSAPIGCERCTDHFEPLVDGGYPDRRPRIQDTPPPH